MVVTVAAFQGSAMVTRLLVDTQANPRRLAEKLIGTNLEIPEKPQLGNRGTLVFSLSTSCHFCTASAPFYRKLAGKTATKTLGGVRIVAVLPENAVDAESYIRNTLGVSFDSVVRGSLSNVVATPTLLLLDSNGIVMAAWVGLLTADEEAIVTARVLSMSGAL